MSSMTLSKSAMDRVGMMLNDRYRLDHIIGAGGMGVVYRVHDTVLSRNVVVKVLQQGVAGTEADERFKREARGLSRLEHENVVKVHEYGVDRGLQFIVMEYVEGRTLAWLLRKVGPMPLVLFASIASQIAAGVGDAHRSGMVHRDLKPANVMVCRRPDGSLVVKILDFGLAKLRDDTHQLTQFASVVGSAGYMAPEQVKGLPVDPRADVYALGVIYFRMLTGRRLFDGPDDMSVMFKHLHDEAPSLVDNLPPHHDIPPRVIELVERCLSKTREDRPAHGAALLEELIAAMPSSGVFRAPLPRLPELSPEELDDDTDIGPPVRTEPGLAKRSVSQQDAAPPPEASNGWMPAVMVAAIGVLALLLIGAIGASGVALVMLRPGASAATPMVAGDGTVAPVIDPEARKEASRLREQAIAAMGRGDAAGAIEKLERSLELDPSSRAKTEKLLRVARGVAGSAEAPK